MDILEAALIQTFHRLVATYEKGDIDSFNPRRRNTGR
jgi:hypothetical protein